MPSAPRVDAAASGLLVRQAPGAVTAANAGSPGLTPPLAVATVAARKNGRTRYVRLFPERTLYMLDRLSDREFIAAYRLMMEFVITDANLPADDAHLACITKLSAKAWAMLRDKLLQLGLGRIEHGFWIDDDQLANLDMQRAASMRGAAGGRKAAENRRQRDA